MTDRIKLQSLLEQLFESRHVYYQSPGSLKMEYPAIVYSKSKIGVTRADNSIYTKKTRYEIIVIDKRPDNPVIDKLLSLPYCSYDRQYKTDDLNHDVLTLYF